MLAFTMSGTFNDQFDGCHFKTSLPQPLGILILKHTTENGKKKVVPFATIFVGNRDHIKGIDKKLLGGC